MIDVDFALAIAARLHRNHSCRQDARRLAWCTNTDPCGNGNGNTRAFRVDR